MSHAYKIASYKSNSSYSYTELGRVHKCVYRNFLLKAYFVVTKTTKIKKSTTTSLLHTASYLCTLTLWQIIGTSGRVDSSSSLSAVTCWACSLRWYSGGNPFTLESISSHFNSTSSSSVESEGTITVASSYIEQEVDDTCMLSNYSGYS